MKTIQIVLASIILLACQKKETPLVELKANEVPHSATKVVIDGSANDKIWQTINWKNIDQTWLGSSDYTADDFTGKYKLAWDKEHLYILAEIVDDKLMDYTEDGLQKYWDDDCIEIFIDEDASGGDHQYNYNAFAYHVALDGRSVDVGVDSLVHYYDHIKSVRKTEGNTSIWEVAMDLYDDSFVLNQPNQKVTLTEGKEIGFALAYCDNDNSEHRENFIGSVAVEGNDKDRGWIDAGIFEKLTLK